MYVVFCSCPATTTTTIVTCRTTAPGTAYPTTQTGYAVATAATPAQPTGYEQAYQTAATPGTYATTAASYDYGYGRTTQYDTSKTYYQQAGATATGYTAAPTAYDTTGAGAGPKVINFQPAKTTAQYTGQPQTYVPQQQGGFSQAVTTVNSAPKSAAAAQSVAQNSQNTYSGYDAALYSATTMYVAQQQQQNTKPGNAVGGQQSGGGGGGWQGYKKNMGGGGMLPYKPRNKPPPKPQPIHYCDVCKISCAGPQTYREHLEGQKHKKRELLLKQASEPGTSTPARPANSLHCELCDVTCTGNDAYAAHVRGAKHQKVVKLHTKLGKPIPACDPAPNTEEKKDGEAADEHDESVKPVGSDYIEEIKDDEGKLVSFSCKLCECKFNDPNAKEMHMKGRRHRLQYKKKVQPDLFVDIKPTLKQKKMAEARAHRQAMQEEFWNRRRMAEAEMDDGADHGMRQFGRHPFFGMLPGRRPESSDDRHVVARHAEIYPKEEELQTIQRIVSHTERALKLVSDAMTTGGAAAVKDEKKDEPADKKDGKADEQNKGDANQMISFQKDAEGGNLRLLKGVMRVGLLAKGLLLQGDNTVELVVLCAEKPTVTLLKRVVTELPVQLKKVAEDHKYTVTVAQAQAAVLVEDGTITVKISLTSPLLREDANSEPATQQGPEDLLPREPCLEALAALRHAKWFQARATGLQSCVMIMRIMRDLCVRIPIWGNVSQWAMELLTEKIISSSGGPLTPGECMRRVMEALASSLLVSGPGLLDPCEKEPEDALAELSKQQREDITVSAQMFLRFIAFRQIHKVLGMDPLPPPKFVGNRNWRFNRKRRRSGTEGADNEADGKMVKKEDGKGDSGAANVVDMDTEGGK